MTCRRAGASSGSTRPTSGGSRPSMCRTPRATRSRGCGRRMQAGRRTSCRPSTTATCGTRTGSRRATATRISSRGSAGRPRWRPPKDCVVTSRPAGKGSSMLKVAIVGCGKIADSHAAQIGRITGSQIVGVCDREPLMARQLAERFPIARWTSDLGELLATARPDVVHVTTPPASHLDVARACLAAGCHVYVEKPFAIDANQTEALIALATENGRKLTVGHDDQFSHVARRLRALVQDGYLGGRPIHIESVY